MLPLKMVVLARELEPGWLVVHFEGSRPVPWQRYPLLDKRLREWLAEHPDRILLRTTTVENRGQVIGLMAWHGDSRGEKKMNLQIGQTLIAEHGREYLEAVISEIAGWLGVHPQPEVALAIVNRRGIVTIVDSDREYGTLMTLEKFLAASDGPGRKKVETFMSEPHSSLLVIPLQANYVPPPAPPPS